MVTWINRFFGIKQKNKTEISQDELNELLVLPLDSVLFPGSVLPLLQIEGRYREHLVECAKADRKIGVCLIDKKSNGSVAIHPVGTIARVEIENAEGAEKVLLSLRGILRFEIEHRIAGSELLIVQAKLLPEKSSSVLPTDMLKLQTFLQGIVAKLGEEKIPLPHAFDDENWVGYRLSEILPIQALAKQKLLELEDSRTRLEILSKYLHQHKLIT